MSKDGKLIKAEGSNQDQQGHKTLIQVLLSIVLMTISVHSRAMTTSYCAHYIDRHIGTNNWHFPTAPPDVLEWHTRNNSNPNVTAGDFDNDGIEDAAFLIVRKSLTENQLTNNDEIKVVVCLSSEEPAVRFIDDLYCEDAISTTSKGSEYFDYETQQRGRYPIDGIGLACGEKAGATYIYQSGKFIRVIDSD